ncbi:MAG: hypothetical protein R3F49_19370 [Planctomycetota bacterium]
MPKPSPVQVEEALARLADIHAQVARGAHFRGYRALPVAAMGVIALIVAGAEWLWSRSPAGALALSPTLHASLWLAVAVACASLGALDIVRRYWLLPRRATALALAQLTPALAVGAVLGVALWSRPELLPGVWTMVFGLGVLASCPYLPRAVIGVAMFYIVAGAALTLAAREGLVASPWTMGVTFGVGQLASAAALSRLEAPEAHPSLEDVA